MQQKLLAEMAQAEFLHSLQGSPVPVNPAEEKEMQDALRAEAMRKIMEAERMEEKRKRKLEKIRYMVCLLHLLDNESVPLTALQSRYNDLMTQSDKDFITRIQVSQLVTQDPFSDDFYAQVHTRVMHNRLGVNAPEAVLKFGSGGGVGLGLGQHKGGRRQSAMQRMEAQVERIVNNARLREKEKICESSPIPLRLKILTQLRMSQLSIACKVRLARQQAVATRRRLASSCRSMAMDRTGQALRPLSHMRTSRKQTLRTHSPLLKALLGKLLKSATKRWKPRMYVVSPLSAENY